MDLFYMCIEKKNLVKVTVVTHEIERIMGW